MHLTLQPPLSDVVGHGGGGGVKKKVSLSAGVIGFLSTCAIP